MNSVDRALETQLKNIEARTGRTRDQLAAHIHQHGVTKHSAIRDQLRQDFGLGYGDANTLAHYVAKAASHQAAPVPAATPDDVVNALYSGAKADLRPIHDAVMAAIGRFGAFEVAPKKGYVSLRRKKQFAMITPATKTRLEVGLNMNGVAPTSRLLAQPAGGMCQYKVHLTEPGEVDQELVDWIKQAYESAG